jgi:hypothetical protein
MTNAKNDCPTEKMLEWNRSKDSIRLACFGWQPEYIKYQAIKIYAY